jgi:hypothetical protein
MGRVKLTTFLASALVLTLSGVASPNRQLCEGFLPPNDMKIPIGDHSHHGRSGATGITEAQYNDIMDRIQKQYVDVVKAKGGTLVINRLWSDATVNSSAEQQGGNWIINMYGGIARHPDTTYEGEALIACHEMGHHLGGAPKLSSFGGTWASNEGQADYFATLKCLRQLFLQDDNSALVAKMAIDPLVQKDCTAQFTQQADQDICMRISKSGESVAYLFQDLTKSSTRPKFDTPDTSEVKSTNDDHPATQCRMDTYLAGDICQVPYTVANSDTDFKVGSCVQGTDALGFRSRCWFSPDGKAPDPGGGNCPFGDQSICDQLCQLIPQFCQ